MRAVQLDRFGAAEEFRIVDVPIPEPKEDEVLIRVSIAGIIFADTQMRRGVYVNLPPLPFIPGREVAGIIEKVGTRVKHLEPGMRVTADMPAGGYAEFVAAPAKSVICLPDRVSFQQGIVYHRNLRIAYLCYYVFGQAQKDETILLHAAAGGIGTLLLHIAKRRANNVVLALSSSDEKLAYCRSNGANYCINYETSNYVEEVSRFTGTRGVDLSINSVGGPTLKTDPLVIKPRGRWVIYGYAAGKESIDPYQVIMPKALTISIFSVYAVREREEFRKATDFLEHWLRTEELDSVVKTFPLEEVVAAHHWIEGKHSHGKTALVM